MAWLKSDQSLRHHPKLAKTAKLADVGRVDWMVDFTDATGLDGVQFSV